MKNIAFCLVVAAATVVSGCVSANDSPYRGPGDPPGVDGPGISPYDFQQCAAAMVDSMLANKNLDSRLKEQFPDRRPVVLIEDAHKETFRMIDLGPMMDTIRSRLVNSGKFDFVDREADKIIIDELIRDKNNPLIADEQVPDAKTHVAADYILTGTLAESRAFGGREHECYYKLSMRMFNRRTRKIDWSAEKMLHKVGARPVIGW